MLTLTAQQTRSGTFAAFSSDPEGSHVITGDAGITAIKIWDVAISGDAEVANLPTDYLAPVDVAYLPDGRIVAPIDSGSVSVWDVSGGPPATIGPGSGSAEPVWRIAVSADGTRIATVRNFSGIVTVWDTETGNEVFEVGVAGEISAIDWSPDGEHLVAASWEGTATILDADGAQVRVLDEGEGFEIHGVAFSPDGRSIATAVFNRSRPSEGRVSLWDWERAQMRPVEVVGAEVVEFDPTGATLAVGRFDGVVEIRGVPGGERVLQFGAHSGTVGDLAFSPDGTRIATSGDDATARLFDAATGVEQLVLRGHGFLVSGIAFSPDGTRLASASPDGVVRVWALDLDDLIAIAEDSVTRGLSDDECRQYLHLEGGCR